MEYPLILRETSEGYDDGGAGGGDEYEADDAEEWEGPTQEEWQSAMQFQQQAGPVLQQLGQYLTLPDPYEGQYEEEGEEFDPYDADSVQNYIGAQIQSGINEALGPFQGLLGSIASREGETLAKGELENIAREVGDFDRDNAFLIANGMIEQGQDPAHALRLAAQHSKEYEDRIRADEREKYRAELENLAGAPRETGTGSFSATEGPSVPTGPDRYRIAVERRMAGNHTCPTG